MYLNVYVPQLQRIGGVVWYLRGHLGQRFASTAGVAPKTDKSVAAIQAFAKDSDVDMVSLTRNQRKDDVHALLMFVYLAREFTNKELRQAFAVPPGQRSGDIKRGRMSYELRRLRLHGLIERIPKSHRYHLTELGLRTAMFYTRVYSRVLRPGLATVSPEANGMSHSTLQRAFRAAENAVFSWCDNAKIAA